jgi:hypothetical protein
VEDIAEALAKIHRILEGHRNNLPHDERGRIAHILREISKKEHVFEEGTRKVQKIIERISKLGSKQLQERKDRMAKASGKEKQILQEEIEREEEKLRSEKALLDFQTRQRQHLEAFNKLLLQAVEQISHSPYPYDAKPYLEKARLVLRDVIALLKEMRTLEKRLLQLTKAEHALLRKERQAA